MPFFLDPLSFWGKEFSCYVAAVTYILPISPTVSYIYALMHKDQLQPCSMEAEPRNKYICRKSMLRGLKGEHVVKELMSSTVKLYSNMTKSSWRSREISHYRPMSEWVIVVFCGWFRQSTDVPFSSRIELHSLRWWDFYYYFFLHSTPW